MSDNASAIWIMAIACVYLVIREFFEWKKKK